MIKTYEILRIVKGNEYPIKVFLEQMGYNNRRLTGTAVDLRQVEDLYVQAVSCLGYKSVSLESTVSPEGNYVTIIIPDSAQMRMGPWGVRMTGVLNGWKIASAERHVFDIVQYNGQTYLPPIVADGEGCYMLNMKFEFVDNPYDGEGGSPSSSDYEGYIGFATFNPSDVSTIDLSSLEHKTNVLNTWNITNATYGARLVVVVKEAVDLSFTNSGLNAVLSSTTYNNRKYYYTDPLQAVSINIGITRAE